MLRCYRCGSMFEASAFAESTGCARCGGAVRVPDVTVDKGHWGGAIQTAGRVHVMPGCTVRSSLIVASGDVLIEGSVHAMIIAGGQVRVTSRGQLRGGARCKTLIIEPGAVVFGGPFETHSEALGTVDIEMAARSTPGKGPAARIESLETDAEEPSAPNYRPAIQPEITPAIKPALKQEPEPLYVRTPGGRSVRTGDAPRLRVVP